MVWGSIARELENGTISSAPLTDAGLDEGYPMYVLPVDNFLEMNAWKPHQDLLKEGKLRQYDESMRGRILFCSHQWCSYNHPDPENDQLEALQGVLKKLAAGQMEPRGNGVVEHAFGMKLGRSKEAWKDFFHADGGAYIWFDFASMPQPLAAKAAEAGDVDDFMAPHMGDHRQAATVDAGETLVLIEQLKRAVDSIPSYIERCAEMFILVPSVKHADRQGEVCDFNTWRQRGWCRMEFVSSRLCCANDIPCMVITSRERTPEYFNLCDTMRLFAGHGNFTVSDDKTKVAGVLEKMIEAKAVSEYERGNIGMFRAYLTLSGTFLMGLPKAMEMPEGVTSQAEAIKQLMKWRDDATEAAWMKQTGCTPLHIACGLGNTAAVKEMVQDAMYQPYLNKPIHNVNKLDKEDGKGMGAQTIVATCQDCTPLAIAMLCGDGEMLKALIDGGCKADYKAFAMGCMMGSPANMTAFLDIVGESFDINHKSTFSQMGNSPLHNVCMMGDATSQVEKIELLLSRGAAKSLHTHNFLGFTPLSALCANADANPACVKLLVDAGAKIDKRDKPGLMGKTVRGLLSMMAKTKKFSNMQMMVDMMGYGRSPLHHAAHLANVGMLRALHEAGAPVTQLDKKRHSATELIQKKLPDSHAPELLADMLPAQKLKAAGQAARAIHKLKKNAGQHAQVLPNANGMEQALPVVP